MFLTMIVAATLAGVTPPAVQQVPATVTTAEAQATIAAVRRAIAADYVVPERRAALDAALAKGLTAGRYTNVPAPELASRVTADMAAVANDKHLGLQYDPRLASELGARPLRDDDAVDSAFFKELARTRNHGVVAQRVLDGNVRYIDYQGFMWTGPETAATIDAAMAFLKGGDAAIIDLRRNGGGDPAAVRHLTSWFVPGGTTLVTFHMRGEKPDTSVTPAGRPGTLGNIPVYVLTSGGSASAAEEFASHVKGFGFATLVGQATAGAAYRNNLLAMPGGYVLSLSVGRPVLPGGGDWEGKGVAPAVAVAPERALAAAHAAALTKLAAAAEGLRRKELEWAAAVQAGLAKPAPLSQPAERYAGRYGERVIAVAGDRLSYRRGNGPETMLVPIGPDLFAIEADPRSRIHFPSAGTLVVERITGAREESRRSE